MLLKCTKAMLHGTKQRFGYVRVVPRLGQSFDDFPLAAGLLLGRRDAPISLRKVLLPAGPCVRLRFRTPISTSAQRHRSLPQSSSASRFTAGASGFFILSQSGERAGAVRRALALGHDPSSPSLQAWRKYCAWTRCLPARARRRDRIPILRRKGYREHHDEQDGNGGQRERASALKRHHLARSFPMASLTAVHRKTPTSLRTGRGTEGVVHHRTKWTTREFKHHRVTGLLSKMVNNGAILPWLRLLS
jgi:hypothetical protein